MRLKTERPARVAQVGCDSAGLHLPAAALDPHAAFTRARVWTSASMVRAGRSATAPPTVTHTAVFIPAPHDDGDALLASVNACAADPSLYGPLMDSLNASKVRTSPSAAIDIILLAPMSLHGSCGS